MAAVLSVLNARRKNWMSEGYVPFKKGHTLSVRSDRIYSRFVLGMLFNTMERTLPARCVERRYVGCPATSRSSAASERAGAGGTFSQDPVCSVHGELTKEMSAKGHLFLRSLC